MRCSVRVPMMLRVRPAQLTITVVSSPLSRTMSDILSGSSAPGTLRPPGMQKRLYSSGVRVSSITILSPRSMRACRSTAVISGTPFSTSTRSPKSLLGTLTPHSVGSFSVTHWLMPPARCDTSP